MAAPTASITATRLSPSVNGALSIHLARISYAAVSFQSRRHFSACAALYKPIFNVPFIHSTGNKVSPRHDIQLHLGDEVFNYAVEIPKNSCAKLEGTTDEPFTPIHQDTQKGNLRYQPHMSLIEAKNGNPPIMPMVMTPGGPLDLSSILFRNRIIFIGQPVTSQVAQRVISQLLTLSAVDENADILIYLNCPGGSTYSIFAIYDCMSWIKPKVGTVCFGVAASQGALLLAGGEKGMRYSMPNARIMIHQPQTGCGGNVEDVRRQVNEAVQSRHKIDKMYAAFTGQPLEKVQQYTERDRFLSVFEAMDFGLIDEVLETDY